MIYFGNSNVAVVGFEEEGGLYCCQALADFFVFGVKDGGSKGNPDAITIELLAYLEAAGKAMNHPDGEGLVPFEECASHVEDLVECAHTVYHHRSPQFGGELGLPSEYRFLPLP